MSKDGDDDSDVGDTRARKSNTQKPLVKTGGKNLTMLLSALPQTVCKGAREFADNLIQLNIGARFVLIPQKKRTLAANGRPANDEEEEYVHEDAGNANARADEVGSIKQNADGSHEEESVSMDAQGVTFVVYEKQSFELMLSVLANTLRLKCTKATAVREHDREIRTIGQFTSAYRGFPSVRSSMRWVCKTRARGAPGTANKATWLKREGEPCTIEIVAREHNYWTPRSDALYTIAFEAEKDSHDSCGDIPLHRFPLTKRETLEIAVALMSGKTFDAILARYRDTRQILESDGQKLHAGSRLLHLTTKTIRQIGRKYNIGEFASHGDDDIEASRCVMREFGAVSGCKFVFKAPDIEPIPSAECPAQVARFLSRSHFFVAFTTEQNATLGATLSVVGADMTHNASDKTAVYLGTIGTAATTDGVFVPLLYFLTNDQSHSTCAAAFAFLKMLCPEFRPRVLMSDLAPSFYQGLKMVADSDPYWLWCVFHMEKNLRLNLRATTVPNMSGAEAKATLDRLQRELFQLLDPKSGGKRLVETQRDFECRMTNFREALLALGMETFDSYFHLHYGRYAKHWAPYVRRSLEAFATNDGLKNFLWVNNHLEAWHKVLKYFVLGGVKVRMELLLQRLIDHLANNKLKISRRDPTLFARSTTASNQSSATSSSLSVPKEFSFPCSSLSSLKEASSSSSSLSASKEPVASSSISFLEDYENAPGTASADLLELVEDDDSDSDDDDDDDDDVSGLEDFEEEAETSLVISAFRRTGMGSTQPRQGPRGGVEADDDEEDECELVTLASRASAQHISVPDVRSRAKRSASVDTDTSRSKTMRLGLPTTSHRAPSPVALMMLAGRQQSTSPFVTTTEEVVELIAQIARKGPELSEAGSRDAAAMADVAKDARRLLHKLAIIVSAAGESPAMPSSSSPIAFDSGDAASHAFAVQLAQLERLGEVSSTRSYAREKQTFAGGSSLLLSRSSKSRRQERRKRAGDDSGPLIRTLKENDPELEEKLRQKREELAARPNVWPEMRVFLEGFTLEPLRRGAKDIGVMIPAAKKKREDVLAFLVDALEAKRLGRKEADDDEEAAERESIKTHFAAVGLVTQDVPPMKIGDMVFVRGNGGEICSVWWEGENLNVWHERRSGESSAWVRASVKSSAVRRVFDVRSADPTRGTTSVNSNANEVMAPASVEANTSG